MSSSALNSNSREFYQKSMGEQSLTSKTDYNLASESSYSDFVKTEKRINSSNCAPDSSDSESEVILKTKKHVNLKNSTESSEEESAPTVKIRRRIQRLSDSDSDVPKGISISIQDEVSHVDFQHDSDSDELLATKSTISKSRIKKNSASAEDNSDNEQHISKNTEQQLRMKNKKQKMRNKFKTLLSSRSKHNETNDNTEPGDHKSDAESNSSNDELSSIDKIKEKIKERTASLKMSICDPDTSDEEGNQSKKIYKPKKEHKRTKLTSPKPQRMSAKQAMENMQKIKSESNRMLREKEVSLPYHRPKALSLQDIMKRRRPAVSSDGKALPIKMNEEQLKQYALLLEQRQKEMMELCKSDTEEDEPAACIEKMQDIVNNDAFEMVPACSNDKSEGCHDKYEVNDENSVNETKKLVEQISASSNEVLSKIDPESSRPDDTNCNDNTNLIELTDDNVANKDLCNKSGDMSAELELFYNDSVEEDSSKLQNGSNGKVDVDYNEIEKNDAEKEKCVQDACLMANTDNHINVVNNEGDINKTKKEFEQPKTNTEIESQLISLRYLDSEMSELNNVLDTKNISNEIDDVVPTSSPDRKSGEDEMLDFPDEDMDVINMEEIDTIIENAEIIQNTCDGINSPALIRDIPVLSVKPKLTGTPGMVIDLDGADPVAPKKLSGVELLKERFTFFSKLKTTEEMEREREKRQKPGALHLKLKQDLEEKIAEQRSLEWSKRLDSEKQHQEEINAIRGDESEPDDDIDKIEAKLEENDVDDESSSEGEEEPIEDDVLLEDKPKKRNPLVADEAEESDRDEKEQDGINDKETNNDENDDNIDHDEEDSEKSVEESSEEEESSESEDEVESNKPKKGRILKAFEDSDDEAGPKINDDVNSDRNTVSIILENSDKPLATESQTYTESQDDVIQLAQVPKQVSGEIFGSLDSDKESQADVSNTKDDEFMGTQTFSILNSNNTKNDLELQLDDSDKLTVISETQPGGDNLDAFVGMCSGSFSQNFIEFQPPTTQSQLSQSQPIGEDLLVMCTGNFYDNQFVTPVENNDKLNTSDDMSQDFTPCAEDNNEVIKDQTTNEKDEITKEIDNNEISKLENGESSKINKKQDEDILNSVLDELNEPEVEGKALKFFFDNKNQNKENEPNVTNTQFKKRCVIDSDDEINDNVEGNEQKKKKKLKKKKLEKRALQISDDEEDEYSEVEEGNKYLSDNENDEEKLVEYDSEENEVEVQPQILKKKKKKASEFFEQEAELTSEDEWVGSGDEDEAGLDRMEREAGDDDAFNQGRLQRELGQIHMRDVLDQDKREVRLIQELLFEDGDLGAGGRQRKFRWRNAEGEEATGTVPDEFADTQEEELESEEQWRKQRHERELFLKQMKNEVETEDDLNVSVNRSTIIKANLISRTMSSLLDEVNQTKSEVATIVVPEKKTKDIPSPKKPYAVFQQSYHGSLLSRGRGALARLAALASPLADDAAPAALPPSSKRNFVFAALTPPPPPADAKVTKRKAEHNVGTPRLVKKLKTEEKQKQIKSSLLDHIKA